MRMNRCATCKYWNRDDKTEPRGMRDCLHPAVAHQHNWPFPEESIQAGGDPFGMKTGNDFGCVHWRIADSTDTP